MSQQPVSGSFLRLARTCRRLTINDPLAQCLVPRLRRSFAAVTDIPVDEAVQQAHSISSLQDATSTPAPSSRVLTTLYSWPSLEPERYTWYHSRHLEMPLRKDILHRAVIYEADATRQGTASTKWRADVHGSNRKIAPQKGMGRARVGDKKSPIRRGGGVAFGPKPRDFATELPRKIYDIAWRTALSYRYRKGELIVLSNQPTVPVGSTPGLLYNIFKANKWGKGSGRTLLVTDSFELDSVPIAEDGMTDLRRLFRHMQQVDKHGEVKDLEDVDVKDLLSAGRIVIDQYALNTLLAAHSADLGKHLNLEAARFAAHGGHDFAH